MEPDVFDRELEAVARLLADGALEEADQRGKELLDARPSNPLARNLMALLDFARGRYDEAHATFSSLARRNADVVTLRVNAGIAALCAGEHDSAHDHLRRAVDLDPAHRRAFAFLAVVHLGREQPDLARAALLEAGFSDLAELVAEQGNTEAVGRAARALADRIAPGSEGTPASPLAWEGFAELDALERAPRGRGLKASGTLAEAVERAAAERSVSGGAPKDSGGEGDSGEPDAGAEEEVEAGAEADPDAAALSEDVEDAFDALQVGDEAEPKAAEAEADAEADAAAADAAADAVADAAVEAAAEAPALDEEDALVFEVDAPDEDDELSYEERRAFVEQPDNRVSASGSIGADAEAEPTEASDDAALDDQDIRTTSTTLSVDDLVQALEPLDTATGVEAASEFGEEADESAGRFGAAQAPSRPPPTCFAGLPELPLGGGVDAAADDGGPATLAVAVEERARADRIYVRQDLLAVSRGELHFEPAARRRKGAKVPGVFEIDGEVIWRVSGAGEHLLRAPSGHVLERIAIVDEAVYVAERCLAGYSAGLRWENGRLPGAGTSGAGGGAADRADAVIELTGRGEVYVHAPGPLHRVTVGGEPVEVRADCLVGWAGNTVPCAQTLAMTPGPHLECRGSGVLMVCLEARGI